MWLTWHADSPWFSEFTVTLKPHLVLSALIGWSHLPRGSNYHLYDDDSQIWFPAQTCLVGPDIYSHIQLPAGYSFIIFLLSPSLPPLIPCFINALFHLIQASDHLLDSFTLSAYSLISMSSHYTSKIILRTMFPPFLLSLSSPGLLSHLSGESCASPVSFLPGNLKDLIGRIVSLELDERASCSHKAVCKGVTKLPRNLTRKK